MATLTEVPAISTTLLSTSELLHQYGRGPVQFSGTSDALYERHLLFDHAAELGAATARDRFEASARAVRDMLSQRWALTEKTYERQVREAHLLSLD